MYPCDLYGPRAPGLYTYYAIMSLIVVVLAVSLIWFPVVQLITEINTIITKVVIYFNVEFLGYNNTKFFHGVELLLISHRSLVLISLFIIIYALYLAAGNFLSFLNCYLCNLPEIKELDNKTTGFSSNSMPPKFNREPPPDVSREKSSKAQRRSPRVSVSD